MERSLYTEWSRELLLASQILTDTNNIRDIDALSMYETGAAILLASQAPTRYAVRQVLDQELQRATALRANEARQARFRAGNPSQDGAAVSLPSANDKENIGAKVAAKKSGDTLIKRDFFGRIIEAKPLAELDGNAERKARLEDRKVWVTFHEGLNNAVRKPISVEEFLRVL